MNQTKALRHHACPTSMEANLSNNPNDSTEHEPHVHARFQSHCVRGYVYCTGCQDFQTAGVVVRFGVVRRLLHPPRYIVLPPCPPQPGLLRGNNRPTQIDSTFNPSCIIRVIIHQLDPTCTVVIKGKSEHSSRQVLAMQAWPSFDVAKSAVCHS